MIDRLVEAVAAQSPLERRRWYAVGLCGVLFLFHTFWFTSWLIEDAAISMAFAENAANGEGFVASPGGEWVEGFSNPTWTLLLTATSFLGLSPFMVVKVVGIGFGLLTLPLAYLWARRTAPDAPGLWPVLAPLGLAMSTPFALWACAGLENALFNLLLAAGAVAVLRDGDRATWGLSGVFLGLLAFTRPEAPLYAGLITVIAAPRALRMGGIRWLMGFFIASAGPFFAWHAWRYWAFAWPFPNTYYAKQTENKFVPLNWNGSGWKYLRQWALWSVHAPMLPLFTFGQTGVHGVRAGICMVVTGILLGVLVPGLTFLRELLPLPNEPTSLVGVRVGVIVTALLLLPLLGWGREGQRERAMAWGTAAVAMFFAVYSGGDWMRGARWMSMASVPLSVLLADSARTLAPVFGEVASKVWFRLANRDLAAWIVAAPILVSGAFTSVDFLIGIETTPFDVRRRVLYMQGVGERLDLEHESLLDVDMGAHMMWSGFEIVDLAGLCNVPFAHNHFERSFVDSYVGEENPPTYAHLHGGWANKSGIIRRSWFKRRYIEIPGYGHNKTKFHIGNHIRKDLLVQPEWAGSTDRATDFGPLELEGLELPSPTVHPGGRLQVELGWSLDGRPPNFRALFFFTDGQRLEVRDLPPAYDWLEVPKWRHEQVVYGRYALDLPEDLAPGSYDIGLVVLGDGPKAEVLKPEDGAAEDPVFMAGELRWTGAFIVTSEDEVIAIADAEVAACQASAEAGDCTKAEENWHTARHHLGVHSPWQDPARARAHASIAACWARRALDTDDVEAIVRARRFDHNEPVVQQISALLADRWQGLGDVAMTEGDEDGAWMGWSRAIRADPARAWVRRRIEEMRARRLEEKK